MSIHGADAKYGLRTGLAEAAGRAGGHCRLEFVPGHAGDRRCPRGAGVAFDRRRIDRRLFDRRSRAIGHFIAKHPFGAEPHRLPKRRSTPIEAHRCPLLVGG